MADLFLINPNTSAPDVPIASATQDATVGDGARIKVAWAECPGAYFYTVYEGTETGKYTKRTKVDAARGKCEYISDPYDEGATAYFLVTATGTNGVESDPEDSTEVNCTIDVKAKMWAEFDLEAPAIGGQAAAATIPEGADYTVATTWTEIPAEGGPVTVDLGATFEEGKVYEATVVLTAKATYSFAEGCQVGVPGGAESTTVTRAANGETITIVMTYAKLEADQG